MDYGGSSMLAWSETAPSIQFGYAQKETRRREVFAGAFKRAGKAQ